MNYWLVADTHLGHTKMLEVSYGGRPSGYEDLLFKNIQQIVQPQDVLIHLGDFCFYNDEEWHRKFMEVCPGKRWLVKGNHDRKSLGWYLAHGWDAVADSLTLQIYGKRVTFSHRPLVDGDFDLNIHGHLHNSLRHPECTTTAKHRLIYMEHTYTPLSLRKTVEQPVHYLCGTNPTVYICDELC